MALGIISAGHAAEGPVRVETRPFVTLPPDARHPEALAVDTASGDVIVGTFDATEPATGRNNQLLRYSSNGELLSRLELGETPLTGLVVRDGSLYFVNFATAEIMRLPSAFDDEARPEVLVKLAALEPATLAERHVGNPDGSRDRIAFGSSGTPAPNGLTFDAAGNLYISDSFQAAIFRVRHADTCAPCPVEVVVRDPLLATTGALPFGANGLAFDDAHGVLYVNNAGDGRVLALDLAAGTLSTVAENLLGADGLLLHDDLLWVAANQLDTVVGIDRQGLTRVVAGGFGGIDAQGAPIGLLFPAATAVAGDRMIVANLALPITARAGDEWEERVTRWNLVQFDLPPGTGGDASAAVTAPTRHVEVRGDRIGYRRFGAGKPLVLLNRFRGTLDTWDPAFLDALGERREVYVVDFPGIGYSGGRQVDSMQAASAFVDGFVEALGLESFAILGWSWGGLAAQAYYLDHPGRATHAVLLATNPAGRIDIGLQPSFLDRALKPVNDLADDEVLFFEPESDFSRRMARASRARIHERSGVDARIPSTQAQYLPYFAAAEGFHEDLEGRRERIIEGPLPVLVIAGDNDNSTAGQNWFPLIGQMRNARFVFYADAGHAPHHQHPATVARVIADFLEEDVAVVPDHAP